MSATNFRVEVLKLLLQVAWADHEIQPDEAHTIRDIARQYRLDQDQLAELERYLAGQEPLPAPNLGVLRERKQEVMIAVQTLLLSDLQVVSEEREVLAEIETLLA
jgi:hypothetical protein